MAHEMRDLRAPNLVLAGHAIGVRTRTADVPALHDGGPPPRSRHMPRQQLSTRSASEAEDFKPFRLWHAIHSIRCSFVRPHAPAGFAPRALLARDLTLG